MSSDDTYETQIPVSVYQIFILYEDFEMFQYFYDQEKGVTIHEILNLIKYSIRCSSLNFTVYFAKRYKKDLSNFKAEVIEELLKNFQMYLSEDTLLMPHLRWIDFEEKLYLFETLISGFTFSQVKKFTSIIKDSLKKNKILTTLPLNFKTLTAKR